MPQTLASITGRETSPHLMGRTYSKIAHDILRYLRENPEAADTSEGVAAGWLRDSYTLAEVRRALRELVGTGLMVEVQVRYGRAIYRVNRKPR